jgi:predicted transcriptional regulator
MTEEDTPTADAHEQWQADRTTFQRVYDVLVGTYEPATAKEFAERADCSANGARRALEQLAEMGIADRTASRPATYKRNPSYFQWKRIENLAREHSSSDLRARIDELIEQDETFQEKYGVPEPDAVVAGSGVDDHEGMHERWEDLTEWRTIRRDINLLERAVQRADSEQDDRVRV